MFTTRQHHPCSYTRDSRGYRSIIPLKNCAPRRRLVLRTDQRSAKFARFKRTAHSCTIFIIVGSLEHCWCAMMKPIPRPEGLDSAHPYIRGSRAAFCWASGGPGVTMRHTRGRCVVALGAKDVPMAEEPPCSSSIPAVGRAVRSGSLALFESIGALRESWFRRGGLGPDRPQRCCRAGRCGAKTRYQPLIIFAVAP